MCSWSTSCVRTYVGLNEAQLMRSPGSKEVSKVMEMVGAARFELATSCTPSKRASQATLRPDPSRLCLRNKRRTISRRDLPNSTLFGSQGKNGASCQCPVARWEPYVPEL